MEEVGLEPSDDLLRGLLGAVRDALLVVDHYGRIVFADAGAVQMFGWPVDDLRGTPIATLLPDLTWPADGLKHTDPAPHLDVKAARADGTGFTAEVSRHGFETSGAVAVAIAVRDVTMARRHETRSASAHRLGRLASGVAHEFNNLLGVILNYTTLLERQIKDSTALADIAEIRSAAQRAATLTRQLVAFTRRGVTHPEPIDVNEVVREFGLLAGHTLGEHIEFDVRLSTGARIVVANPHHLEEILLNLVHKARDAMFTGGVLTVATGADEQHALIDVTDSGVGMYPDVITRAEHADDSASGSGLATVFSLVRRVGGETIITSTPNVGTEVSIALPLAVRGEREGRESTGAPADNQDCILLVEDDEALRGATARILTEQGYRIILAADGVEAIQAFRQVCDTIDLVVTDVAMPRMRGEEMVEQLRLLDSSLPVIFMSGHDPGSPPFVWPLLEKPVPEDVLLDAIRKVLDA
jgi:two-component system cell cycle sensor histidine kinase/response regulator CckA